MFNSLSIRPASSTIIMSWSNGEVKNAETINYRTFKPEPRGLFCTKIFGTLESNLCNCTHQLVNELNERYCLYCGINKVLPQLRRDRLGHLKLVCSVVHYWYIKTNPYIYTILLNFKYSIIIDIIYCNTYIITRSKINNLPIGTLISDDQYFNHILEYGSSLTIETGGDAIKTFLIDLNIDYEINQLLLYLKTNIVLDSLSLIKILKKLRLLTALKDNNINPEWFVLSLLPILPPTLRPLLLTKTNKFTCSDINIIYQNIIIRNYRLKKLLMINAPYYIIKEAKRSLQYTIDELFGKPTNNNTINHTNFIKHNQLKTLNKSFVGKKGRFRNNLLGKRVDYSARTVIVVEPNILINQCGIPLRIILELYKPILLRYLMVKCITNNIKQSLYFISTNTNIIINILGTLIYKWPILLNRAPTLHRMNIQSFYPYIVYDNALHIHPLVCKNFNADFDGDQMAIYIPLSNEAKLEANSILSITNNLFSPANGELTFIPSQEIMLGLYFLTYIKPLNTFINNLYTYNEIYTYFINDISLSCKELYYRLFNGYYIRSSIGRIIFLTHLPYIDLIVRFNKTIVKSDIYIIIKQLFIRTGNTNICLNFLTKITKLGFKYITLYGYSLHINNFNISKDRDNKLIKLFSLTLLLIKYFRRGKINLYNLYFSSRLIWINIINYINYSIVRNLSYNSFIINKFIYKYININPLVSIIKSGAKNLSDQINQICGIRGLVIINNPIISLFPILDNLTNGLSVNQYFISLYGSRKGLCDTSIKTASSGYLTRKLVYLSQNNVVYINNCNTLKGIRININSSLNNNYVVGKLLLKPIYSNIGKLLYNKNIIITNKIYNKLKLYISYIYIRTPLYCLSYYGICRYCYGIDISSKQLVNIGSSVGVISAQSICEPCTQLTMRTFHTGGFICNYYYKSMGYNGYGIIKCTTIFKIWFNKLYCSNKYIKYNNYCIYCGNPILTLDILKLLLKKYRVTTVYTIETINTYNLYQLLSILSIYIYESNKYCLVLYTINKGIINIVNYNDHVLFSYLCSKGDYIYICRTINNYNLYKLTIYHNKYYKPVVIKNTSTIKLLYRNIITNPIKFNSYTKLTSIILRTNNTIYKYIYKPKYIYINLNKSILEPGDIILFIPRLNIIGLDITDKLNDISTLFDSYKPTNKAYISRFTGYYKLVGDNLTISKYKYIKYNNNIINYNIINKYIINKVTNIVLKGSVIVKGIIRLNDILVLMGLNYLIKYFIDKMVSIYNLYGITINYKHYELLLKNMVHLIVNKEGYNLCSIPINLLCNKHYYNKNKIKLINDGYYKYSNILLGVYKSISICGSFISSASFRDTIKVLMTASIYGLKDYLIGIKENIIFGFLPPLGTGLYVKNYNLN